MRRDAHSSRVVERSFLAKDGPTSGTHGVLDRLPDGSDSLHGQLDRQLDLSTSPGGLRYELCHSGRDVRLLELVEEVIGRDDEAPLHRRVDIHQHASPKIPNDRR